MVYSKSFFFVKENKIFESNSFPTCIFIISDLTGINNRKINIFQLFYVTTWFLWFQFCLQICTIAGGLKLLPDMWIIIIR